ncbi:SSI family serine proteinase inhibitor [Kitasatospora sp. LaBMicrA B282]|uniref:SSI family serine proteinase inhibitor n=1 Tax=Kitasatospora sp. LaBMicrA B282 TaxID=3420949 RepID=UPI003D09C7B4
MISLRIRAALSALALAFLTVPTPAQAQPADLGALLHLAVRNDTTGATERVDLLCAPDGGTHPDPAAACAAIAAADGDLDQLRGDPGVLCNNLYQPVTAFAHGFWFGTTVAWSRHFANPCGLRTRTDPVFRF